MLNFQELNFDFYALEPLFRSHPYLTNILACFIAFIESMVVVGIVIPGAIVMPIVGFFIGAAIIPSDNIILWAIFGAIVGDCLNYFIGSHFKNRICSIWPFTRWPTLFERSEKFFKGHGGKSVFLGRFIGPIRAFIPMIAGMLQMPFWRFLIVTIPAASLWTLLGILPGILLGALSLELPPKVATKFIIICLAIFLILWGVIWLVHHFFKSVCYAFDKAIMRIWQYWRKQPHFAWLVKFLSDPRKPDNHQQLTLIIAAIFTTILFLYTWWQTLTHGILVDFGQVTYHLLNSLRISYFDHFFVLITFFGDASVILLTTGAVCLWLLWKKQWYRAKHLLGAMGLGGSIVVALKFLMHSPRPGDVLYNAVTSSFPSAHTTVCLIFYGFLAILIAHESKSIKKYLTYIITGTFVTLIAFSRLYLGAHWLIDVIGGTLLGLTTLLITTISYRRHHVPHLKAKEFGLTVCGFLTVIWLGYSIIKFGHLSQEYVLNWPQQNVTLENLIQAPRPNLPLYRTNRLGRPSTAFNVVYIGSLTKIEHSLQQQGWESQSQILNLQNLAKSIYSATTNNYLTVLPQLYHNTRPALLMIKSNEHSKKTATVIRLWPADINLTVKHLPVWLGTVELRHSISGNFSIKRFTKTQRPFLGATDSLAVALKNQEFNFWEKHYPSNIQPHEMAALQWNGKLLVVTPAT